MTEQVLDTVSGPPEPEPLPTTPKFSAGSDKANSEKTFDEDALVGKIVDRLRPEIERTVQSTKDKRLSALDKLGGVDELLALKDYIKAQGGDVDKGMREFQIDRLLQQQTTVQDSPAPVGTGRRVDTTAVQTRTAELLNDAGIPFDDPDYKALAGKTYATPDDFYHAVSRMAIKRQKKAELPPVTQAAGGEGGGNIPGAGNRDERLNRLYAENQDAQKRGDLKKIKELKAKILELGGIA